MSLALSSRRAALAAPWVRNELWRRARAVPSLDLRFADDKSLRDAVTGQSLVTFTRASSGTFVGSDGVLRTATTNLLLRSEEFDDAGWTKSAATVTANAGIAPNGTLTADKFIPNTTNAFHFMVRGANVASGATITYSVYAKADGYSFLLLNTSFGSTGGNAGPLINLSNGTKAGFLLTDYPTQIQSIGNGWYRISFQFTSSTTFAQVDYNPFPTSSVATYAGDGTAGVLLWGAQLEQSSTVGEYIPTRSTINSAPRFDHNPTTGESLGLLVEEQRTNSIRNNTMVGAVAGTPGTLPTNWAIGNAGTLSTSIIGTGTESGITYVDLQISGTSSTGGPRIRFEALDSITAASGQTWTGSAYVRQVGGSTTNITSLTVDVFTRDTAQTTEVETFTGSNITSLGVSSIIRSRSTVSGTLANASSTRVCSRLTLNCSSGVAIDITLRIGLPQLEQGAFATSVIPTTTATVTRSADVASITGANFSSWYRQDEGTVFAEWRIDASSGTHWPNPAYFDDGTSNNWIGLQYRLPGAKIIRLNVTTGGVSTNVSTSNLYSIGSNARSAGAIQANNYAVVHSGGAVGTGGTGSPPAVDRLRIGFETISSSYFNGTIKRLSYWPQRLPNSTLQAITR